MKEYKSPIVTIDNVVLRIQQNELQVLLILRKNEPFAGAFALPGGYCRNGETTINALERITIVKAGVQPSQLPLVEQLFTFDSVARDPRGHAVSVSYLSLGHDISLKPGNEVESPRFVNVNNLPDLAFDHAYIITTAVERLRSKLTYTNIAFALLPAAFTLTQLQNVYQIILGRALDKRNFRKKILQEGMVEPTGDLIREGAHRPAAAYRFVDQKLSVVDSAL